MIGDKGDNTWWNDNLAFKAGYDFSSFSKLLVSYMQGRYNYSYKDPNTYLINAAGDKTYYYNGADKAYSYVSGSGQREQSIYNASYEAEIGVVKAKLNLGLTDENTNWYTTPGSTTATKLTSGPGTISSTPNQNFNSDIQFTVPLWSRNIVTFGGSYKQGSANTEEHSLTNWTEEKSTNYLTYNAGGKDQTFSLFLQDEILIFDNLTAYLGFREDWWRTYDGYANQFGSGAFTKTYDARTADAFSPKLAIVYKPFSRTTVRTSAGQAFRAPSVYELYRTWVSSGGVTYNGNPDLKPETVRSWDIGISQGLWKGAKVGVTYFENYMEDLIYRKTVTATRQDYINAGKADSKGATFEVEQRFDKWLRLFGNYTYTDARVRENSSKPTTVGKRLIHMPEQMANGGFELEWGAVSASVTGRYVGKRFSDDENKDTFDGVYTSYDPYFTADAKISCKIGQYVVLTLAVDNIADESHFDYYKAPGRLWFSELTLRF